MAVGRREKEGDAELPKQDDLLRVLTICPSQDSTIFEHSQPSAVGQKTSSPYTRPYQSHVRSARLCRLRNWSTAR